MPGKDAFITYTGEKAYDHLEYNMQTAQFQGQLKVPEYTIGMRYMSPEEICDYMVTNNRAISNAQSSQRIANLQSEAIQGVNTYHTNYGGYGDPEVVKADVRWDHVYQNSQHPDVFAANEGAPLEFGVDFEELKKTNGDY